MVSFKNTSLWLSIAFLGLSSVAASTYAAVSDLCNRYDKPSEHYRTCSLYDAANVIELQPGANLNTAVNNGTANQLFIIPSSTSILQYFISEPLVLKANMGLLASSGGESGFFDLVLSPNFSIGSDSIYCLIALNENINITGLRINASQMSDQNVLYFNQSNAAIKTLIYSPGNSSFNISWSSLTGRPGLDGTLWARNSSSNSCTAGQGRYRVNTDWIHTAGAKHGLFMEATNSSNETQVERFDVENNVVILDNINSSTNKQIAIHAKYGRGSIRENSFVFRNDDVFPQTVRVAQILEDLSNTQVMDNVIISEQSSTRTNDVAYEFIESSGRTLRAGLYGDLLSDKISVSTVNASGRGVQTVKVSQSTSDSFNLTESEFFSSESPIAGSCAVPRFLLQNELLTEGSTSQSGIDYRCGTSLARAAFNFPEEYDSTTSASNGSNGYYDAAIVGWTIVALATVQNIALGGYYFIYKPWKAFRKTVAPEGAQELVNTSN